MANGATPVRQRMINMMYLVLTALLAINVSKEVLDGFIIVNSGLEESGRSMSDEMSSNYVGFENEANNMPGRVMAYWKQAEDVRAQSEELVNYISRVKAKVIMENESLSMEEVIGKDEFGVDTVIGLQYLDALDNIDVISQVMVGSDATAPKKGELSASELRSNLNLFREKLSTLLGDESENLLASVNRKFDFSDRQDASGVMQNWEAFNFHEVPMAAGVTMLSKIQNDVRLAEADVVKWLRNQVNEDVFVNTVMTPAVISPSNFVVVGDSFHADIFLTAYDDKNPPVVELALEGATIDETKKEIIGPKRILPIGRDGKAKLIAPTSGIGEFEQRGVIRLNGPNGEERFLFSSKHRVAKPALVASPTKMNVFYRGVENPVDLSVAGYTAAQIQPTIDNGSIRIVNGEFVVKPGSASKARISVVATDNEGNAKRFGPVEFRVKNFPAPLAYLGSKNSANSKINKSEAKVQQRISAKLPGIDFNVKYEVISAKLQGYNRSGDAINISLPGGKLTQDAKAYIGSLRNQKLLQIGFIKARVKGTTSPIYDIPSLNFKVIDN